MTWCSAQCIWPAQAKEHLHKSVVISGSWSCAWFQPTYLIENTGFCKVTWVMLLLCWQHTDVLCYSFKFNFSSQRHQRFLYLVQKHVIWCDTQCLEGKQFIDNTVPGNLRAADIIQKFVVWYCEFLSVNTFILKRSTLLVLHFPLFWAYRESITFLCNLYSSLYMLRGV